MDLIDFICTHTASSGFFEIGRVVCIYGCLLYDIGVFSDFTTTEMLLGRLVAPVYTRYKEFLSAGKEGV